MHKLIPFLCLMTLVLFGHDSRTQGFDHTRSRSTYDTSSVSYIMAHQVSPVCADTINLQKHLHGFHDFLPRHRKGTFFQRQSNPGHALSHLELSPELLMSQYHGGYSYYHAFEPYLRRKDNIRYLSSVKPFTELFYVMGSDNEQHFTVLHAQPLTANVYFSVEHKILHAPGIYQRSFSKHESPVLNLRYRSSNNKYNALATYFHNSISVDEHGGIRANTYFSDSATFNERSLIPVHLAQAEQLIRGGGFHIRQSYAPWADSIMHPDSTQPTIYHDIYYQKDSYSYRDDGDTTGFYPSLPPDTEQVFDSMAVIRFTQSAGVTFSVKGIAMDAGLTHEYARLWQQNQKDYYNRLTPKLMAKHRATRYGFSFQGSMDFLRDPKQYTAQASMYRYFPEITLTLHGGYRYARPVYMYQKYRSPYFNWDNNFHRTGIYFSGVSADHQYGSLSASFYGLENHIYMDTHGVPQQDPGTLHMLQVKAQPRLNWRFLHLTSTMAWQYHVNGNDLLRLPELMGKANLYASFNLIQDVLNTHAGVQVLWHSAFQGHRYIPATRSFALQDQQMLGDYPYLSVFANFFIDRARFFVRYSHVNALLDDRSYFLMPGYPMRDDAFQFGVSWTFYD